LTRLAAPTWQSRTQL